MEKRYRNYSLVLAAFFLASITVLQSEAINESTNPRVYVCIYIARIQRVIDVYYVITQNLSPRLLKSC